MQVICLADAKRWFAWNVNKNLKGSLCKQKTQKNENLRLHYENTPIQIYRKFHLQKLKIFR